MVKGLTMITVIDATGGGGLPPDASVIRLLMLI